MRIRKIKFTSLLATVIVGIIILMAICPSLFTSIDPLQVNPKIRLSGPMEGHWLGTDEVGRDIWARLVYGTRPSVEVGFGSATLAMFLGVPLGLIAGYAGGWVDNIIMRIMDAFMSFPSVLLAILLITIFDPSVITLILTISIVSFPAYGRIVRSSVLSIKARDYTEAAKASGATPLYIMFRTILPNCASSIIVQFTLFAASAILIEAGMSFLGLGIQPPTPAWGSMLNVAKTYIDKSTIYIIAPTAMIFLTVLSINLLGDALREWLDPTRMK